MKEKRKLLILFSILFVIVLGIFGAYQYSKSKLDMQVNELIEEYETILDEIMNNKTEEELSMYSDLLKENQVALTENEELILKSKFADSYEKLVKEFDKKQEEVFEKIEQLKKESEKEAEREKAEAIVEAFREYLEKDVELEGVEEYKTFKASLTEKYDGFKKEDSFLVGAGYGDKYKDLSETAESMIKNLEEEIEKLEEKEEEKKAEIDTNKNMNSNQSNKPSNNKENGGSSTDNKNNNSSSNQNNNSNNNNTSNNADNDSNVNNNNSEPPKAEEKVPVRPAYGSYSFENENAKHEYYWHSGKFIYTWNGEGWYLSITHNVLANEDFETFQRVGMAAIPFPTEPGTEVGQTVEKRIWIYIGGDLF